MPDIQMGFHTIKSHGAKVVKVHAFDWIILLLLVVIDVLLNLIEPFHRFVGEGMMTNLQYPLKDNTVPFWAVPVCLLYSILIAGVITDAIKDAVGRPRPDFFWRCFPDGKKVFNHITREVICHGKKSDIKEGYKSFPSGHTSWSFAGLGFLSWYLSGKIRVFDRRGHSAKLCILFLPLLAAALVGITRVDDYWHHWTDVFTGGLIGLVVSTFCYLQSFPYPNDVNGWAPYLYFHMLAERNSQSLARRVNSHRMRRQDTLTSLSDSDKDTPGSSPNSNLIVAFNAVEYWFMMKRRKYDRLESSFEAADEENDENMSMLGESYDRKLMKNIGLVPHLKPKMMSSIMYVRRLRDAYTEVMHRFAEHFIHLNNGNPLFFKKVSSFDA
ncbi:hypothetical protein FEM48_Zijuj05G0099900 [Ziziphus jujuba var. spinosa]|uniref:Phosphatidic acid phosphatase type 2/haloperoxidase domain-containing protein n=1 Tax=Ziziphus jujuba var. spinosa TaxID=714518 RepID=A0A978VEB1_ZIZJJ|nr:hypothetical protein FEM48_Zijuj05G0099900 [Ziziphus jujuba var. spinosa]